MPASRREFAKSLLAAPLGFSAAAKISRALNFSAALETPEQLAARLATDPLRPQLHLLPAKNWMNDPNGPIFWNGVYHMFFQYNPGAAVWGDMHWAHAVSTDMIHWRHLPVALAPTPGWADADGCFTGSAVDDDGTATILYTGVSTAVPELSTLRDGKNNFREVQCLATSRDPQLRTWEKWKTPVIEPPADAQLTGFRDPFLWRDADHWYLGVASGIRKQGGRVLLYRSKNLRDWKYLHPLASGPWTGRENTNPVDSGEMWECPDFFALGGKHVLLYSTAGKVAWETGELDPKELVFHSQRSGVLDYGAYYAQKTQLDSRGNRILWGWIPEKRPDSELRTAGWAGCMALPRLLSLSADSDLEMRIAPEAESLRGKSFSFLPAAGAGSRNSSTLRAFRLQDLCGEIFWKAAPPSFRLALTDNAGPWWSLQLETQASGVRLTVNGAIVDLPTAASNADRSFHLVLDASVAELICDGRHALTTRIYRKPDGPLRMEITDSDLAQLRSLQAWPLRPISSNRLTS